MALLLTEAAKLSNDVLLTGVIETIVKESPVLQTLPLHRGRGQRPHLQPGERGPNGLLLQPRRHLDRVLAHLHPGHRHAQDPRRRRGHRQLRPRHPLEPAGTWKRRSCQLKAKALRTKFEDTFIGGDSTTDAKSFDGVDKLAATGQTASMGTNGGTLTLAKLDEMIDLVKEGKPHILLMSRRSRRKLTALSRAAGSGLVRGGPQRVRPDDGVLRRGPRRRPTTTSPMTSGWAPPRAAPPSTPCSSARAPWPGSRRREGSRWSASGAWRARTRRASGSKWYAAIAVFNALKLAKLVGVQD